MEEKITILVVDEIADNRKRIMSILKPEGHRLMEAFSGQNALEILFKGQSKIDFVILSLNMKQMSVIEMLNEIRQEERYRYLPVIISVKEKDAELESRALELGADNFFFLDADTALLRRWFSYVIESNIMQKHRMEKQIQEAVYKLDTLIDTVPGGIATIEYDGKLRITYFNDVVCNILGYSREELERLDVSAFFNLIIARDRKILEECLRKLNCEDSSTNIRLRVKCKNGGIKWLMVSLKKYIETGKSSAYHIVMLDISQEQKTALQLKNSRDELKYQAKRDGLTGIYNRATFYRETAKMLKEHPNEQYILAQWNVDHFRVINELFGSGVGDHVLRSLASQIAYNVGGNGTYARLEADHFVTCTKASLIEDNMDKIEEMLSNVELDLYVDYPIMMHAGFYSIHDTSMPVSSMCDRAAIAAKHIKSNYLQRTHFYDSKLKEVMLTEQELVKEMERALEERQFIVYFQPIIDAKTRHLVSAEALVRWKHPEKGVISPGVFIPLFEKNGFITKLDYYVCEEVCRYLSERICSGYKVVPISVNLSRINFYNNSHICEDIVSLTKKYNISPEYLKLEITESAYTDNAGDLIKTIDGFRQKGFKVLMDDFGSGYSSLNMLKDVSVDILKIDMKFMEELGVSARANNILFNIIQMAKGLNMNIVGEGVETQNQYELLTIMGCDSIQGYYFSKPITEEEFSKYMVKKEQETDVKVVTGQVVLIVDDVKLHRKMIRRAIEKDYEVIEARDGQEAYEILKKNFKHIDLVITDIYMPRMSGLELLEKMHNLSYLKTIPALVVTSYDDRDNISRALKYGTLDVIGRPYNEEVLRLRVRNLLKLFKKECPDKEKINISVQISNKDCAGQNGEDNDEQEKIIDGSM